MLYSRLCLSSSQFCNSVSRMKFDPWDFSYHRPLVTSDHLFQRQRYGLKEVANTSLSYLLPVLFRHSEHFILITSMPSYFYSDVAIAVLELLDDNPFPDKPPKYLRAVLYRYQFANKRSKTDKYDFSQNYSKKCLH